MVNYNTFFVGAVLTERLLSDNRGIEVEIYES